jgi:hypothetical protein
MQLTIKAASSNNYDTQGLGLLALNGALLAADVAARDVLENFWWAPLVALLISAGFCVRVLARGSFDVGKALSAAVIDYAGQTEPQINALLVGEFITALQNADQLLAQKASSVGYAEIALGVAGAFAITSILIS